ncbi:MAG: TIGR02117 family protein [bacterium]
MILIKVLKKIIVFIFFGIAGYLAVAVILSLLPTHPADLDCQKNYTIYVNTNGVHIDIIIPKNHLDKNLATQLQVLPSTGYIAFGWGDKKFYLNTPDWSDLTFPVAFQALFLRSETAMHVTRYRNQYRSWKPIKICSSQLDELNQYISSSFETDDKGNIIKIDVNGYGYNDYFYEAKGSFSLFTTCNIWVNKALKEIQIKTSVWSPFDFGILYHLS